MSAEKLTGKLAIIAGGGPLPGALARVCQAQNHPFLIIGFNHYTDKNTVQEFEHYWFDLGRIGAILNKLHQESVTQIVMIGPLSRLRLRDLKTDLKGAKILAKIGFNALGDNGTLGVLRDILESEGFTLIGVDDLMKDILMPVGLLGKHQPDEGAKRDMQKAIEVATMLGRADVGQAVIVQQGLVLGVEAAEGTDALIARCGALQQTGAGGVLVKLKKPGQDRRLDLPTIGLNTVQNAIKAGLQGIAVQAGEALFPEREKACALADKAGLFLMGITVNEKI